jgi:hypothetical protein
VLLDGDGGGDGEPQPTAFGEERDRPDLLGGVGKGTGQPYHSSGWPFATGSRRRCLRIRNVPWQYRTGTRLRLRRGNPRIVADFAVWRPGSTRHCSDAAPTVPRPRSAAADSSARPAGGSRADGSWRSRRTTAAADELVVAISNACSRHWHLRSRSSAPTVDNLAATAMDQNVHRPSRSAGRGAPVQTSASPGGCRLPCARLYPAPEHEASSVDRNGYSA